MHLVIGVGPLRPPPQSTSQVVRFTGSTGRKLPEFLAYKHGERNGLGCRCLIVCQHMYVESALSALGIYSISLVITSSERLQPFAQPIML